MKLTVVSFSRSKIGGIENNLDVVLPELERRGHRIQFLYFHDDPRRASILAGVAPNAIHVPAVGSGKALDAVRRFAPDLINVHGDVHPSFQAALLPLAPNAYSVHNYYGVCVSGLKVNRFPIVQPCRRTFGPACLLHYLPRRCGGLNPATLVRRYALERDRLAVLSRYDAVITHSRHMEDEYRRHGILPDRVHGLPYEAAACASSPAPVPPDLAQSARLLFAGRMEDLKGGRMLIGILPALRAALGRPIHLDLAGEGPRRASWERYAAAICLRDSCVSVRFHGWQAASGLHDLYRGVHLLVLPSLWPEPFGKVGLEAAAFGLPSAAFDVGGVSEWLTTGVNGVLAPGNPPTAAGLALAIAQCLADPAAYLDLRAAALRSGARFQLSAHVDSLVALFEQLCAARPSAFAPPPAFPTLLCRHPA